MDKNAKLLWSTLMRALPKFPDESVHGFWTDEELILCESEEKANEIADFLEAAGCDIVTGYYDPAEDKASGMTDRYTGYAYISIS